MRGLESLRSTEEERDGQLGCVRMAGGSLQDRFRLERLLADVSVLLLNVDSQDLEGVLVEVSRILGESLGVDRAAVYGADPEREGFVRRASWSQSGLPPDRGLFEVADPEDLAWWSERILSGESLRISSVEDLPPTSKAARSLLARCGVCSILVLPLVGAGKPDGFLSLESTTLERCWSDSELALCRTVGNLLVSTFERMRTMEALRTSRRLARTILDAIPTPVSLIDTHTGTIVDANQPFLRGVGSDVDAVLGHACHEVAQLRGDPCLGPDGQCPLHTALASGEPNRVAQTVRGVDGSERHFETIVSPVHDERGEVVQVVHQVLDVTAHRLNEAALRRTTEAATAASETKSIFVANVSHELRTPLNPIVAMSKLLELTPLDDEQQKYVELIQRGAEQLLATVNDLLDFSKAEIGRLELERVGFDPAEILAECASLCAAESLRRGIELRRRMSPEVPSLVTGDPLRLRQVLHNLLSNAIKFTKQGEIRISVQRESVGADAVTLRFEVADTGIGIPAERLEELFESFTQADASVARKHGGTGLGLAISRQLVALMGGDIGVQSEVGQGSTFWFTAVFESPTEQPGPLSGEARAERSVSEAPPVTRPVATILVVEDDRSNQRVAEQILRQGGYSVDVASNGLEALDRLRSTHYDLVLMDVQMPELDGIEATRRIRDGAETGLPTGIPIIAATALSQPLDRERCIQAGMSGFIAKPIHPQALLAIVARKLRRSSL